MPEKKLWTRHVGMEALNSVGSTGSCDSIESISSNHSAFSGDGYDHLSAEERECLMFLEETIGSLDNEDDSGLSNDEVETTKKGDNLLVSEPVKIPFSDGKEKISSKTRALPNSSEWPNTTIDLSGIPQGHHSFPRVQVPKEEITKGPFDFKQDAARKDQPKPYPEKPKRMSVINQQHAGESNLSEFLILPPPEAFRDPQIVDKRHSVTDPTDAREVRLDRIVLKSAVFSEHKEAPATITQSDQKLQHSVFPRLPSPNKFLTGEQESLNQAIEKPSETQFKQGPPTAPKPRMLPPHIVIKTSKGDVTNLDPQNRPRTFSAHERSTANESVITTVLHAKEQERARHEALQKLGLDEKSRSPKPNSIPPSKTDLPVAPSESDQGNIEAKRRSFINKQEKADSSSNIAIQPQKSAINVKNDMITRNRISMKTTLLEKVNEPASGTPLINQKETHGPITSDIIKTKHSEKTSTQVNPDELKMPSITNMPDVTVYSKNVKSDRNASQVNPVPQRKEKNIVSEPVYPDTLPIQSQNSVKLQTNTASLQASKALEENPAPSKTSEYLKRNDQFQSIISQQNKTGSLENINIMSTSPRNRSSFSPPKEPLVSQHSPTVMRNDGKDRLPVDKSNRHSTHFEPSDEPYLCLPQGSVPGLRQINIKSNTLERSGVGLSSSLSSIEKGGNSFFKKPIFSGNFLRNNRPRPASLGTGKDFANLEASTAVADNTEKHSFFSRPSRQSAPLTSVKIAPKGSTDEHRRQALKKLGILKE